MRAADALSLIAPFPAAEEHATVPAGEPAGIRPPHAGRGSPADALRGPVPAAPAAGVWHEGTPPLVSIQKYASWDHPKY